MTFITNTITSANPALDLYTALASALATEGYVLVDTQVISTRTHRVWKSPAASNTFGQDWYLDVAYTTAGAGGLYLYPFESYDPATHLAYRGLMYSNTTAAMDATTGSLTGATGAALESAANSINPSIAGQLMYLSGLPTTSFGYWISITPDRVIAMTSVTPTFILYTGLYTPTAEYAAKAGAGLFPLVCVRLFGTITSNSNESLSSTATASSSLSTHFASLTRAYPASGSRSMPSHVGAISRGNEGLRPQIPGGNEAMYPKTRLDIDLFSLIGFGFQVCYGTLKDIGAVSVASTVVRGDTVSFTGDAVQWRLSTADSNLRGLVFRAS